MRELRAYTGAMNDLVFLLLVAGFFALAVGFVRVCDRIVGRGESGTEA